MIKAFFTSLAAGAQSRCGEDGQALVELALTMPLLIVILVGAAEFARATYAGIEVSNAARAAVQYGAMTGGHLSDTNGMTNAIQNDSFNLGTTVTISSGFPTSSTICSDGSKYSGGCTAPAGPITTLSVKTQTTFKPLIQLPGLSGGITMYGFAQEEVLD
ncbi:MAG TPA: TadE/TadG family type IV pilus assembly protein [Terracidiphilus sp.]|nr:TadE/TadG family type IV pilus assembly protein [Terracidiphilus sp.]